MSSSTQVSAPVRTAFAALIDYAGLFPPAKLGIGDAVREFQEARSGNASWMLGRFIVPASRMRELAEAVVGIPTAVPVSAIVDADRDPRNWLDSLRAAMDDLATVARAGVPLRVEALELLLPALSTRRETYDAAVGQFAMVAERAGLRGLPIFIEIPRDERWDALLPGTIDALARMRFGAKLRCGGLDANAVPSVETVATFLKTVAAESVPFKATAGLHHPIRHFNDASGFTMHGFLNLLAAAAFARQEAAPLEEILAEQRAENFRFDEAGLQWRDLSTTADDLAAVRERGFIAYGSCSFAEPVADLVALGLLRAAE